MDDLTVEWRRRRERFSRQCAVLDHALALRRIDPLRYVSDALGLMNVQLEEGVESLRELREALRKERKCQQSAKHSSA